MANASLLGTVTWNTTAGSKTVTATPAVGDQIFLVTAHSGFTTTTTAPTDNNADGLGAYTLVASALKNSSADLLQIWRRNALIGNASSTVFTHAPATTTGGGLGVIKVTGIPTAGTAVVIQSGTAANQAASSTPTITLGRAASASSVMLGAVFSTTNGASVTQRTGYTEQFDAGYNTPASGLEIITLDSGETTSSFAWGSTVPTAYGAIVVEINAPAVGAAAGTGSASGVGASLATAAGSASGTGDAAAVYLAAPPADLWQPTELGSKLQAWLKGDTLTGTNGSSITTWTDSGGNGWNATGATNKPTLVTSGLNGFNTVAFAGASQQYFTLSTSLLSGRSGSAGSAGFAIYKNNVTPTVDPRAGAVLGDWGSAGLGTHDPYSDNIFYEDYCSTARRAVSGVPTSTSFRILGLRSKTSDWRLNMNGTNYSTDTSNTFGVNTLAPLIGRTANGGNYLDGQIAEIVDCNDFLTDAEAQKVEGYLAWKWGLQSSLPIGHPYKSSYPVATSAGSTGAASGTSAANAVPIVSGSAAGTSTANAVAMGIGSASGTGAANAKPLFIGSAAGVGAASGVGQSIATATGSATGTGAVTAVGASTAVAAGASTGAGSASAVGGALVSATASAAGIGAATAVGSPLARGTGSAAGTGAAAAASSTGGTASGAGASSGTGSASGVGQSLASAVGASGGLSAANANGTGLAPGTGQAAGTSTASAAAIPFATGIGLSAGFGIAVGAGQSIALADGGAAGLSTADAGGIAFVPGARTYPLAGVVQPYPGDAAQTYPLEGIPQQYPLAS